MKKLTVIIIGLLLAARCLAATHYVVPPGTPGTHSDPYTSWATAGTNILEVVNAAMTNTGTRMVWVTNGEYCLTNQIMITNITVKSFSGNYSNTLVYAGWPTYTNRCFYVVNSGVVDGFTISNGHFMVSNEYDGGGGAYISAGTIQNCKFVYNVCSNMGVNSGGGGVYVAGNGIISNCTFYTNYCYIGGNWYGGSGGAIHIYSGRAFNCTVISNWAGGRYGGGIYLVGGVASNCFLGFNYAYNGGGIVFLASSATMTDSVISNNAAAIAGGGVFTQKGVIRNSTIVANRSGRGGGIALNDGGVASNCNIYGNISSGGSGGISISQGGFPYAVYFYLVDSCKISNNISTGNGGGVGIQNQGQVRNCLISNNTNLSGNGGGVYLINASLISSYPTGLVNCTIVNNWSTNEGGGIAAYGPTNYIVNCVIAANTSVSGNYPNVYYGDNAGANSSNFYYSCVVTAAAGILAANQGNITNEPMFKDPGASNYRLSSRSPCVNTGSNQSWMTNAHDLDGRIRIRYGVVDMGAYEAIYEGTIYKF